MVQLTCITTRGGDKGKTSLGDGSRVGKDHARISALGEVDEVNAVIGVLTHYMLEELRPHLLTIQNDLFDVGADLCMPEGEEALRVSEGQVKRLDGWIAHYNKALTPLTSFVLPGGHAAAAYLHLLRTVARRSERVLVALDHQAPLNPYLIMYLNRLSDLAFVWARYVNKITGSGDVLWKPGENR